MREKLIIPTVIFDTTELNQYEAPKMTVPVGLTLLTHERLGLHLVSGTSAENDQKFKEYRNRFLADYQFSIHLRPDKISTEEHKQSVTKDLIRRGYLVIAAIDDTKANKEAYETAGIPVCLIHPSEGYTSFANAAAKIANTKNQLIESFLKKHRLDFGI